MSIYSTEDQAQIVWEAARRGREAARSERTLVASFFMCKLSDVAQTSRCLSLAAVARNAATDINNLLNGPRA